MRKSIVALVLLSWAFLGCQKKEPKPVVNEPTARPADAPPPAAPAK